MGEGNIFSLFTPGEGTSLGRGVPTFDRGYLPWMGDTYLGQEGTYLGWGVPTLTVGVPTLAEGYPKVGTPSPG